MHPTSQLGSNTSPPITPSTQRRVDQEHLSLGKWISRVVEKFLSQIRALFDRINPRNKTEKSPSTYIVSKTNTSTSKEVQADALTITTPKKTPAETTLQEIQTLITSLEKMSLAQIETRVA